MSDKCLLEGNTPIYNKIIKLGCTFLAPVYFSKIYLSTNKTNENEFYL